MKNFKLLDNPRIYHLEKMFSASKLFNYPAMNVKRKIKHDAKGDTPSYGRLFNGIVTKSRFLHAGMVKSILYLPGRDQSGSSMCCHLTFHSVITRV